MLSASVGTFQGVRNSVLGCTRNLIPMEFLVHCGILEFSVKLDHELISMPKSKDRFVVGKRYYLTEKGKINGVYSHNEDGRDYFKDVLDPESHFILKQDNTISFSDGHPLESYREYPTAVELTLQEIADKFGISVNQLRIIK